jgi:hypothetical protein
MTDLLGSIYFVLCNYIPGHRPFTKIGFTLLPPRDRLSQIQVHCPFEMKLIRIIDNVYQVQELWLHHYFRQYWERGEWFRYCPSMLTVSPPDVQFCTNKRTLRFQSPRSGVIDPDLFKELYR